MQSESSRLLAKVFMRLCSLLSLDTWLRTVMHRVIVKGISINDSQSASRIAGP